VLVRISETELGLVIRVPEEGQKFLDGQLFGEMIRHVCDVMQVASAAKQSKGLSFPKTTGVARLRPTSDDFKETVRAVERTDDVDRSTLRGPAPVFVDVWGQENQPGPANRIPSGARPKPLVLPATIRSTLLALEGYKSGANRM
jgi:hypothetical protein